MNLEVAGFWQLWAYYRDNGKRIWKLLCRVWGLGFRVFLFWVEGLGFLRFRV